MSLTLYLKHFYFKNNNKIIIKYYISFFKTIKICKVYFF